ncbi:hypothetical protein Mapa_003225 [Marchantia paleacea]|nr:hypothetical protein Mapa_003225 [Marchantia paleacea]
MVYDTKVHRLRDSESPTRGVLYSKFQDRYRLLLLNLVLALALLALALPELSTERINRPLRPLSGNFTSSPFVCKFRKTFALARVLRVVAQVSKWRI